MHFFAPRVALGLLLTLAAAAPGRAQDSKPVLLSRTGGGSWSNVKELKASADRGNPKACAQLGEMLLRGAPEVPQDVPRALALLEQAARGGEASAAFRVGMLLSRGEFIPQDSTRAVAYFRAASAGGAAEAMHNLGVAYSTGRGVKRDYAEALAWLVIAKKRGAASNAADELRAHVKSLGHPEWIAAGEKRAPELERDLAQTTVTKLLPPSAPLNEVAVSTSVEKPAAAPIAAPPAAVEKPAFSLGATPIPRSTNIPIVPSALGAPEVTIPETPVKFALPTGRALQWAGLETLQKLADQGNADALAALGQALVEGKYLDADLTRGIATLERGAKAGSGDAAFQLADLYAKGLRVTRDDSKAFTFMLQAARGGVRLAAYNLGALYANGTGTKADYTEALAWLIVAQHFNFDSGQLARIRDYVAKTDAKQIPIAEHRAVERIKEIEAVRENLPGL
jgi:TPR repeat protein